MSFKTFFVTALALISLAGCGSQHEGEALGPEEQARASEANDLARDLQKTYAINVNPKGGVMSADDEAAMMSDDFWAKFNDEDRLAIRGHLTEFLNRANRVIEIFDSKAVHAKATTITAWEDSRRNASLYLAALNLFEKNLAPKTPPPAATPPAA